MTEMNTMSIPIEDVVYDVLKQGNSLSKTVRRKFDCEAILMDPPSNTKSSVVRPKIVYKTTLGKKRRVTLSVWKDDLTKHCVDAVVNAANEFLDHVGGLALALVRAGGKVIEDESKDIIVQCGKIATGEVVSTSGGNLPCNYVIHAVGPVCSRSSHEHEKCRHLLQKAIENILCHVRSGKPGITSVAIPAVSSGLFHFPLDDCAEQIVKTIHAFCNKGTVGENLKEIHLVNNDDKTVEAMKKACERLFGSNGSGSVPGNFFSSQSPDSITVKNVTIQIVQGCIEDQKTTVIVNSASRNLNLNEGNISTAILQKAGFELQNEIQKNAKGNNNCPVIKTRGWKLSCVFVYHAILPDAHTFGSDKVLQDVVSICLENARKDGIDSISFPAIGTGNLSFRKHQVAKIMTNEAIRFADRNSESKLCVYFVIHPKDRESLKAFQDELQSQKSNKNRSTPVHQRSADTDFHLNHSVDENIEHEPMNPTIQVRGRNLTDVNEAEKWLKNTMQQHQTCLQIENSHIIYFGADEHDTLISNIDSSVSLMENLKDGSAHIKIQGLGPDVIKAALEIENLLCEVQNQYERKQEEELVQLAELLSDEYAQKRPKYQKIPDVLELRSPVDTFGQQYKVKTKEFQKAGLRVVKMERIHNPILNVIYQSKKDAIDRKIKDPYHELYHRVPAQFYNSVCRFGFNRLYSHPDEQKLGAGIYFSRSLQSLQQNNKQKHNADQYLYIFQADVITGKTTKGKESYIVPPPTGADFMDLYDSVVDDTLNPETVVIFNSNQATPRYLFTCVKLF